MTILPVAVLEIFKVAQIEKNIDIWAEQHAIFSSVRCKEWNAVRLFVQAIIR